jgi:hypothetical protein
MSEDLKKLLEEQASKETEVNSKEAYYRKQKAVQVVNDYLTVVKAKEEMAEAGIKTTKNNIVDYLISKWEQNKVVADEVEI